LLNYTENTNLEICNQCGKNYIRDYRTRTAFDVHDHRTGKNCTLCKGQLVDSIINFGENLPEKALNDGFEQSEEADIQLVLGSSLRVTPAAKMPETTFDKGGKLVICNLQKTPIDALAYLRIFAKCDTVMQYVMEELQIEIPPFILRRRVMVNNDSTNTIFVQGIDVDGIPVTCCKEVQIAGKKAIFDKVNIFSLKVENAEKVKIKLQFMGHYLEPDLEIEYILSDVSTTYELNYDPRYRTWNTKTV